MTFTKIVIICCLVLITLCTQAATLQEQARINATKAYDMAISRYFQQGKFKKALPWALKVFNTRNEILGETDVNTLYSLNILAVTYQKLGNLNEALPLAEKGYRFFKTQAELEVNKTLNLIILTWIYKDLGRLKEALSVAQTGYSLTKAAFGEKDAFTMMNLDNLATIYYELGQFNQALDLIEQNLAVIQAISDEESAETVQIMRIQVLNNLATTYSRLGDIDKALSLYEKVYRYSSQVYSEKHQQSILILNNLAGIYKVSGQFSKSLFLFEKAYRLARKAVGDRHTLTLANLNNLAKLYQDFGRLEEALPLFEKAYRLARNELGEKHFQTLTFFNNLGVIYRQLGRHNEALAVFEKGHRLALETFGEKHPLTLGSLNNLAEIHKTLNHLEQALSLFEQGYQLAKETFGEKQQKTITSLNNLGSMYQYLGRNAEALPLLEKSYRLSKEVLGDKNPLTLSALSNLATLYKEQGDIQESIALFEQLVRGIEGLRRSDLSSESRQTLFKERVINYSALAYLYIKQSRPFDAFRIAEMSKARTLLESLTHKQAAQHSGLTADEQAQLQDYEARLAYFNNRIAKAVAEKRLEEKIYLEAKKNQWVNQFNRFHQDLMAKYPKYAQLSEVEIVEAKTGAHYLPKDAVFISYLVNDFNNVFVFTLQHDGQLTAHYLGRLANLIDDVADYRRQLSLFGAVKGRQIDLCDKPQNRREVKAEQVVLEKNSEPLKGRQIDLCDKPQKDRLTLSRELGKQLLAPLKEIIGDKRRWIISPDGPLALIPFETLRFEGEEAPVIAKHDISYVQSLSVLKLLQERGKAYQAITNRGTLLAMGAPLYQAPPAVTQPPSQVDFNIARHLVLRDSDPQSYERAFRQLNLHWKNLPGAKKELERLEKLFYFKSHRLRIYKEAEASEANLQRLNQFGILAKYRYLLFSAHGYLNPQVPALSAIVLGQVDNPAGIDGYVTAGEWPGYDLKSDLMVLSACETGVGKVVSGEGVMGLPYAFYVAGNKNTLLTLWAVSDKVTAEFIVSFFKKLKAGQGQIEALTATKRQFIKKGGRYSNPVYWAAFLLYGV